MKKQQEKIRIGIFFGGPSREREISFAGGRTVYDNLNKELFEALPVFVDSFGNFCLLDWSYVYKGTIRDFFPPVSSLPHKHPAFQIYEESLGPLSLKQQHDLLKEIGKPLSIQELKAKIDFAFLALHGSFGEDGSLQGLLDYHGIPYSGSGVLPSAIGINKTFQKKMMKAAGYPMPESVVIRRAQWFSQSGPEPLFQSIKKTIGLPFVVRPANQGSSIGVSIIQRDSNLQAFCEAVENAFFVKYLTREEWKKKNPEERLRWVREISEMKDGIGIPFKTSGCETVYHPAGLPALLDRHFKKQKDIILESLDEENEVLAEAFIQGKEFSCIVLRDDEEAVIALPPTEIVKGKEVFDYRSKYLPGLSRKVTPIQLPDEQIQKIREACEELFRFFGFHVYARIDGFVQADGKIFLNDPNTTSGMLPSSFFFHQAAEIGLNPSQFLTFIIRNSLAERIRSGFRVAPYRVLLERTDAAIRQLHQATTKKIRVAVLLGGYSSERHISVESGRNIYEKLASSSKYEAFPVFLTGNDKNYDLYRIPINILLKDNADDIRDKVLHGKNHPLLEKIKQQCAGITAKYGQAGYEFQPRKISFGELKLSADMVFIALHGRPGEDGAVQKRLDALGLPYNGSGVASSELTINKFATNQLLQKHGFLIATQRVMQKQQWLEQPEAFYKTVQKHFHYPFICKPVDDGCSSAVKMIKNKAELEAYAALIFRERETLDTAPAAVLKLKEKEEFPRKQEFLAESLIGPEGSRHFLEITGGMLTHHGPKKRLQYEVFQPSEALASAEVLSLEEKFLAGEGQNITPARFSANPREYREISQVVRKTFEKAARVLGVQGYCRIDAFVRIRKNKKPEVIIIEVNSLPGMTPATCIYHQAALQGYKPFVFIDKIIDFSLGKKS